MAEINWHQIDGKKFERMVGVLLSRLHPQVVRLDGSGGDFGQDARFELDDGPHIFEFKSFTGRLQGSRRKQVKSSLHRAASKQAPAAWTLIVPIQPTDGERAWFEALAEDYDFPIAWLGLDWLNDQMASFEDIRRYFTEDGFERAMVLMREMEKEKSTLEGGAPDAVERVNAVVGQLNELDPHYTFDIATTDGVVSQVSLSPKYEGAERDSPVTVNCAFAFPAGPEGHPVLDALQESLDFGNTPGGEPLEVGAEHIKGLNITAPVGLGGDVTPIRMVLTPVVDPDWQVDAQLLSVSAEQKTLASLAVQLSERTKGRRGLTLKISDRTDIFSIRLKADIEASMARLHIAFQPPDEVAPEQLMPPLLFMSSLPKASFMLLKSADGGEDPFALPPDSLPQRLPEHLVRVVRDLMTVQQETSSFFPMRMDEVTPSLCDGVALVANLLRDGVHRGTWTRQEMVVEPHDRDDMVKHARAGTQFAIGQDAAEPTRLEVFGQSIEVGLTRTWMPCAKVENPAEFLRACASASADSDVPMVIVPGDDERVEVYLHESS